MKKRVPDKARKSNEPRSPAAISAARRGELLSTPARAAASRMDAVIRDFQVRRIARLLRNAPVDFVGHLLFVLPAAIKRLGSAPGPRLRLFEGGR